jgi:predicted HicB family RNase H-like nuclease
MSESAGERGDFAFHYKGYDGTAEVDVDRGVCRGKILFINDLVSYQSATVEGLRVSFKEAVDYYLETCQQLGREPQVPRKGSFDS